MDRGYVKLWRKSVDSVVFEDPELWKLWSLCLMLASHKEKTTLMAETKVGIKINPGEFLVGRYSLHKRYYPNAKRKGEIQKNPKTLWRWLQKLEKLEKLSIKSYSKASVITILNWEDYQVGVQQLSTSCPAGVQEVSTDKNVKNDKKDITCGSPPCPHQKIVSLYNEKLPSLPKVKEKLWNGVRSKNLAARWAEDDERQSVEWWEGLFESINDMPFLLGDGDKGWKADLGWIVKKENMVKIVEGRYSKQPQSEWM
jgi:hypothetical protein